MLFGWHSGVVLEPKWDPARGWPGILQIPTEKLGKTNKMVIDGFTLGRLWEYYYYIEVLVIFVHLYHTMSNPCVSHRWDMCKALQDPDKSDWEHCVGCFVQKKLFLEQKLWLDMA